MSEVKPDGQEDRRRKISYRELGIAPATRQNFQSALDIGSNHGNVSRELSDCNEEITEEDEQAVQLDQESSQGPAEKDENDTSGESGSSLEFLRTSEKSDCFLDTDDQGQSNDEEDLPYR